MVVLVEKRDGKKTVFKKEKIVRAISKAMRATMSMIDVKVAEEIADKIDAEYEEELMTVEEIQDRVEELLMDSNYKEVAKNYIIYRKERDVNRKSKERLTKIYSDIVDISNEEVLNENANMNGATPSGQMMKIASETSKEYALNYLVKPVYAEAHTSGYCHMHDLDYYGSKTTTCNQLPLDQILENGFSTNHGHIRESKHIRSYAANAAIALQTEQNEQHGGQAVPALDFYFAPGVKKSFESYLIAEYGKKLGYKPSEIKGEVKQKIKQSIEELTGPIEIGNEALKEGEPKLYDIAYDYTVNETEQAMEAFIANMNSMHSRGGNQVVFSSINYGTDFTPEGRIVIEATLKAIDAGLGHGETAIFPISVYKVKKGINFSESDFNKAVADIDAALRGELEFDNPNFDLFVRACEVSSRRLFPNFMNLDAPQNYNDKWDINDPERYKYEPSTMGKL